MGITILYIEPDIDTSNDISQLLKNYATGGLHNATNTYEAWEKYQSVAPDIIITEIRIGKIDAIELSKKIRTINENQPIIFLTSLNKSKYLLEAIDININAYILKSQYQETLPLKLKTIISQLKERQMLKTQNSILNEIAQSDNKIRMVFDSNLHAIFLSIGALKMLQISSPDQYIQGQNSLDTLFVSVRDCFYPEVIDGASWILEAKMLPKRERIVAIYNKNIQSYYLLEFSYVENTQHYIIMLSDVTEMFQKHSIYQKKAFTDDLTGIHNRAMLNQVLPAYIKNVPIDSGLAMMMIDIDHFKDINDTFGHQIGDAILVQLASIIKQESRENDLAARWGGEEFVMIVPFINMEGTIKLAQRIKSIISQTQFLSNKNITCSFGIALHREDDSIDSWIQRADTELYRAKKNGRNRIEFSA